MNSELVHKLELSSTQRAQLVWSLNIVVTSCAAKETTMVAKENILQRLLPDYFALDPITCLETRLKYDHSVIATHSLRASRSLRLLENGRSELSYKQLLDLAAALVSANLLLAARYAFSSLTSEKINLLKADAVGEKHKAIVAWLYNDELITQIMATVKNLDENNLISDK